MWQLLRSAACLFLCTLNTCLLQELFIQGNEAVGRIGVSGLGGVRLTIAVQWLHDPTYNDPPMKDDLLSAPSQDHSRCKVHVEAGLGMEQDCANANKSDFRMSKTSQALAKRT